MKKENEPNRKLILYLLIGLFIVIVIYLTVMGLGQLNSSEGNGTPATTSNVSSTVPKVTK